MLGIRCWVGGARVEATGVGIFETGTQAQYPIPNTLHTPPSYPLLPTLPPLPLPLPHRISLSHNRPKSLLHVMLPDADLLWVSFSLGAELTNCF